MVATIFGNFSIRRTSRSRPRERRGAKHCNCQARSKCNTSALRSNRVQATRGDDGSYAFVYSASGKPFTLDLEKLSGKEIRAAWFDPRAGKTAPIGTFARSGKRAFEPPSNGGGNDWVLILDDAARGYPLAIGR